MLKDYTIIDADGHIREPIDLWQKRMDPKLFARGPQLVDGQLVYKGQKKITPKILTDKFVRQTAQNYQDAIADNWNSKSLIRDMDRMGIELSYLYPSKGLWMWAFQNMDTDVAAGLVRAYNDWIYEFASYDTRRLRPVPGVSLHSIEDALDELHRVVKLGARAIFVRPNPINGRTLGHSYYEPLWAECERLNIGVGIHEGGGCLQRATDGRFTSQFATHTNHVLESMMAFLAVLEGGVLERHPKLRFAFLEAGCGWLPFWLWRLDEIEYKTNGEEVADRIKMKPSEYFKRQCYIAAEDEPYLGELVKYIGANKILFASDYPHPDHGPDMTEEIVEMEDLVGKDTLNKIFLDNPRTFYDEVV